MISSSVKYLCLQSCENIPVYEGHTAWQAEHTEQCVDFLRSFSLAWLPVMPFAWSKDPERCSSFIRDLLLCSSGHEVVLELVQPDGWIKPHVKGSPQSNDFADSGISVMSPETGQSYLLTAIAFSVCFATFSFVELIREALSQFWTVSQWQFKITHITRDFPFSFISQGNYFFLLLSTHHSAGFLNLQRSRKKTVWTSTQLLMLVFSFALPEWIDVLHRQGWVLLLTWWHSSASIFTSTSCPPISGQGTLCTLCCQGRKI